MQEAGHQGEVSAADINTYYTPHTLSKDIGIHCNFLSAKVQHINIRFVSPPFLIFLCEADE